MLYLLFLLFILLLSCIVYQFNKLIDNIENSAEDSMFFFCRKKDNKID